MDQENRVAELEAEVAGLKAKLSRKGRARPSLPLDERFWAKVEKTEGCWNWTGATNGNGTYGRCVVEVGPAPDYRVKNRPAHHVSWFLHYGEWPVYVMHLCDNGLCVRPDHLRQATHQENIADAVAKGRTARGERSGRAKLTMAQVEEIRRRYAAGGCSYRSLAEEYAVSHSTVKQAVLGRSYP